MQGLRALSGEEENKTNFKPCGGRTGEKPASKATATEEIGERE